jgi:hypothetical protein
MRVDQSEVLFQFVDARGLFTYRRSFDPGVDQGWSQLWHVHAARKDGCCWV